jgi:alkylation response protein AidB-like acyl-CoA dehydrogenase
LIEGTGEPRIFVVPVSKATLIDNWDVLGLRATGSIDYRIEDAFVPAAFTHVAAIDKPLRGGSLYSLGVIGIALLCHSAWAAGIGRRILDELGVKVQGGVGRSGTLAGSEAFHEQYAKAEGKYRAARAFVREVWSEVAASLDAGVPVTVRQHTMMRLALQNITWTCHEVSQFAYTAAGTVALRAGTMQRLFRDMHAGTQHITSAPPVIRNAGRELAGLAPGKKWLFFDLVDQA